MPQADFVGVVVAAGSARRFGGGVVKQFRRLGDSTVLEHSLVALVGNPALRGVVVVVAEDQRDGPVGARLRTRTGVLDVVVGGATRADSVRAGLRAVGDAPFVLVHDAARPLAGPELIEAVVQATRRYGAAIPALDLPDTIKRVEEVRATDGPRVWVRETLARSELRSAQTPQGSRTDWLIDALDAAAGAEFAATDESAALERAGHRVAVVVGDPHNRKITTVDDLEWARRQVEEDRPMELRVGTGFDVHRFGAGRTLVLGGVEFPGETGLEGHSDADVVLHAAMDALLGAAGLGDIGVLFPPDDPRFAGAASTGLAVEVARLVERSGFRVINLDLTLLAQRPRIRERAEAMRRAIGRSLRLAPERIGLKATTLEGLGALGRAEGIACQAVVLLCRRGSR